MTTIVTPRPPLNLFEVRRTIVDSEWTTIYVVPTYTIPASGPTPQRVVGAAAIMTGIAVCPASPAGANVSVRILDTSGTPFPLINDAIAPGNDFLSISLDRQVLRSGETIQVRCGAGQSAATHLSFILNQREEFTEISA